MICCHLYLVFIEHHNRRVAYSLLSPDRIIGILHFKQGLIHATYSHPQRVIFLALSNRIHLFLLTNMLV